MKKAAVIVVALLVLIAGAGIYYINIDWTVKFKDELDNFFGENNWEVISEETKESIMYSVTVRNSTGISEQVPGKYKNWNIKFKNKYGQDEVWRITNHTYKINNDKYFIFSPKRYSAKQALMLELMDISFSIAGEEAIKDVLVTELTEKELECLRVQISYEGGNPKPEFYTSLAKESWFNINDVSVESYLNNANHDFYLDIFAYNYRVEKLNEDERQHMYNSMENIEKKLLEKYGENADFEIYFAEGYKVKYKDGKK